MICRLTDAPGMVYLSIERLTAARDPKRDDLMNEKRLNVQILINIGQQSDGCTYALHPRSLHEIKEKYAVRPAPSIFVGYDTRDEFESLHGDMWPQIATLLTGLSWQQIESEGGAFLYDPVEENILNRIVVKRSTTPPTTKVA